MVTCNVILLSLITASAAATADHNVINDELRDETGAERESGAADERSFLPAALGGTAIGVATASPNPPLKVSLAAGPDDHTAPRIPNETTSLDAPEEESLVPLIGEGAAVAATAIVVPPVVTGALFVGTGAYVLISTPGVGAVPRLPIESPYILALLLAPIPVLAGAVAVCVVGIFVGSLVGGPKATPVRAAVYAAGGMLAGGTAATALALLIGGVAATAVIISTVTFARDSVSEVTPGVLTDLAITVLAVFGGPAFFVGVPAIGATAAAAGYVLGARKDDDDFSVE